MIRSVTFTAFVATMIVTIPHGTHANDVVAIHLRGHYFAEPATVQITVAVEPAAENRMLRIEADGDRYFRASKVALLGAQDKRLHMVEFKNLPAGTYTLRAEVRSAGAVLGEATEELFVTGMGGR